MIWATATGLTAVVVDGVQCRMMLINCLGDRAVRGGHWTAVIISAFGVRVHLSASAAQCAPS
jgi:hypothetical protein